MFLKFWGNLSRNVSEPENSGTGIFLYFQVPHMKIPLCAKLDVNSTKTNCDFATFRQRRWGGLTTYTSTKSSYLLIYAAYHYKSLKKYVFYGFLKSYKRAG